MTTPSMIEPKQLEALYGVGYFLLDGDHVVDAVRAFQVMIRLAPTDERAWLGLGTCHERLAQDHIAVEIFGAGALVSRPPSVRCRLALARLLRRGGDDDGASEQLELAEALAMDSDDIETLTLVGAERRAA